MRWNQAPTSNAEHRAAPARTEVLLASEMRTEPVRENRELDQLANILGARLSFSLWIPAPGRSVLEVMRLWWKSHQTPVVILAVLSSECALLDKLGGRVGTIVKCKREPRHRLHNRRVFALCITLLSSVRKWS